MDMRAKKTILIALVFSMFVISSSALTLEEGLDSTNHKLKMLAGNYSQAVEEGEVVDRAKYQRSLELFNETLEVYHDISDQIKEVAPEEYKEGDLAMRTARYYLRTKEDPLRIKILARVFKGEADEIIYMANHDGEEPPEEKAEMLGDINLEKAETVIRSAREGISNSVNYYKEAVEEGKVVNQSLYDRAIDSIEEAITLLEDNQRFIKVTEKSEAEYDEAISVLYTSKYFIETKEPYEELEDVEKLFSEEETVEILENLRMAAESSSESDSNEIFSERGINLGYALGILVLIVLVVAGIIYMRKENVI